MDREEKRKHYELVRIYRDYAFCVISISIVLIVGLLFKSIGNVHKNEIILEGTEILVKENSEEFENVIVANQSAKTEGIRIETVKYVPEESIFFGKEISEENEEKEIYEEEEKETYSFEFYVGEYEVNENIPLDSEVQKQVQALCVEYEVPYEIVLGVMEAESSFRDWVVAGNCYGLMMIHSCNFGWLERELGITDLLDPVQNAHAGIHILKMFYEKYGDWNKALVCYNCGDGGAEKNVFKYGYSSTGYSEKCQRLADKWKETLSNN